MCGKPEADDVHHRPQTSDEEHLYEPAPTEAEFYRSDADVLHADLCELLNALGLGAYARPYSAHEVMQRDAIPTARSLRTAYDRAQGVTR